MSNLVKVKKENCINCFKCIKVCPVKYCNIAKDTYVDIDSELCIGCGACVNVCQTNARYYSDDINILYEINEFKDTAIIYNTSIHFYFEDKVENLNGYFLSRGVNLFFEREFAFEAIYNNILDYLFNNENKVNIIPFCPVLRRYIEIYKPELLENLMPFKYFEMLIIELIEKYFSSSIKNYIFITSCEAAKLTNLESIYKDKNFYFIGLKNFIEFLRINNIDLNKYERVSFNNPLIFNGYNISYNGGFLKSFEKKISHIKYKTKILSGQNYVYSFLNKIDGNNINKFSNIIELFELWNCPEGCAQGNLKLLKETLSEEFALKVYKLIKNDVIKSELIEYEQIYKEYTKKYILDYKLDIINPNKSFKEKIKIPNLTEEQKIFKELKKETINDFLNCTSCGYDECRDMAKAIYNGLNKIDNCVLYKQKKIEEYNKNLEKLVKEKTKKIEEINLEIRKELKTAQKIQLSFIPKYLDDIYLLFNGLYQPYSDLGGDYYDYFKINDTKYAFVIADVSGHGIYASLVTAMAKVSFMKNIDSTSHCAEIMKRVNNDICNVLQNTDTYMTALFGIIDCKSKILEYCNAGHTNGIVISKDGEYRELKHNSTLLGIFKNIHFQSSEINIKTEDRIILYTDGIIDIRNEKKEYFGEKLFKKIIIDSKDQSSTDFIVNLITTLYKFSDNIRDDLSLLVIDVKKDFEKVKNQIILDFGVPPEKYIEEFIHSDSNIKKYHTLDSRFIEAINLFKSGKYIEAKDLVIKELLDQYNRKIDKFKVMNFLGHVYYRLSEKDKALYYWEQALILNPYNQDLIHNINVLNQELNGYNNL